MEENTIEIKLVGDQPAGGGGKPSPPVGSSQDTGRVAGERDLRENRDLDEVFASAFEAIPERPAGSPSASDIMRQRQEESKAKRQEEEQKAREQSQKDAQTKEDEAEAKRQERELDADLKRQYREQQRAEREEKAEQDRRTRVLSSLATQRVKEEERQKKEAEAAAKKKEREEKEAEQNQRMRMIQAGQGAQQLLTAQGAGGKVGGFLNLAGSGALGKGLEGFANSPAGGMLTAAGALVDTADQVIKGVFSAQREAVRAAGNVGKAVFDNNYGEAANQATEALAGLAEKVPIVGTLFAEQLRSAADAAGVFGELVRAAADRGRQLEGYSATIAGATSTADVRAMQRDIAEAQRNEETFSRIIDAQSRLEDTSRSVMDPIKDALLEALADVVEPLADIAQDVKPILKLSAQGIGFLIKFEAALATLPLKTLAAVIDGFMKWLNLPNEDDVPNLLDELDRTVENVRNGQAERRPPAKDTTKTNKQKKPEFFGGR